MWALRRASDPLKNRGCSIVTSRICWDKSDTDRSYFEFGEGISEPSHLIFDRYLSNQKLYHNLYVPLRTSMEGHSLSSQAGARSNGEEDDLEDEFSELESLASADVAKDINTEIENEEELIPKPELSDYDEEAKFEEHAQKELELSDTEADLQSENKSYRKRVPSALFMAVVDASGLSVRSALDKWVQEGKNLSRADIALATLNLRSCRMYGRALQLSEWLETNNHLDFVERDYASRLDLIAKVHGLQKAEGYIEKIPKSFKGEVVYRTLLAHCVSANDVKKAEEVFNKMKDLEFPITSFACNQLLLLYKRVDKKKIADVLLLMEKENIKPSQFTYKILIDTKGIFNDITGMDQIVETMKAEGMVPDINTQAIIAKHYIFSGLKDKAVAVLKEMEGGNIKKNRWACRVLLPLYAALGKIDDVGRVWKVCESNPQRDECVAAIEAWGKLKKIEEAEAVFERMLKTWKKLSSRHYSALLMVYANHKMLAKGKDLLKRMGDSGCRIGPLTCDALVRLYMEAGEVEKADSILQKAAQQKIMPMFSSYMAIMGQYAKRGDIYNSEKIFYRMRQAGYVARLCQFDALVQAYMNARQPAYGIRERMKADNIFPNKALAAQLTLVDAFRKTAVSDLHD